MTQVNFIDARLHHTGCILHNLWVTAHTNDPVKVFLFVSFARRAGRNECQNADVQRWHRYFYKVYYLLAQTQAVRPVKG